MNQDNYVKAKAALKTRILNILTHIRISPNDMDEYIFHYLDYDEPQIAYTNLVALTVAKRMPISKNSYEEIVQLGLDLHISNGITWDAQQTAEFWQRLANLISDSTPIDQR